MISSLHVGALAASVKAALNDPYWSNVVCMFNCESLIDASSAASTVTNHGVTVNSSNAKFGSSFYFNGPSYLTAYNTNITNFGSGNFTIELWVNPTTSGSWMSLFDSRASGSVPTGLAISINPSLAIEAAYKNTSSGVATSATGVVTLNTYNHVAMVRNGSNLSVFVNGVSVISTTTTHVAANQTVYFGNNFSGGTPFTGYMDDIRITKGIARYTSNFTPPSQAFPNS